MKIMTRTALQQNRMEWVNQELQLADKGEVLYFVGCLPYFDALFTDLGVETLTIARGAIKILNRLGVKPVVLENERCCGHDLYWSGDTEAARRLAQHNVEEIRGTDAKLVLFTCAECYRTFKVDYPMLLGPLDFQVTHISEYLAGRIPELGKLAARSERLVTYHDPCRLGRHLGIYDPPRAVITALPGLQLREMAKHSDTAICCGTSAWLSCDRYSKAIQTMRLASARATGAELMITTCPKCHIHFTCAMKSQDYPEEARIEVKDLTAVVADALAIAS